MTELVNPNSINEIITSLCFLGKGKGFCGVRRIGWDVVHDLTCTFISNICSKALLAISPPTDSAGSDSFYLLVDLLGLAQF